MSLGLTRDSIVGLSNLVHNDDDDDINDLHYHRTGSGSNVDGAVEEGEQFLFLEEEEGANAEGVPGGVGGDFTPLDQRRSSFQEALKGPAGRWSTGKVPPGSPTALVASAAYSANSTNSAKSGNRFSTFSTVSTSHAGPFANPNGNANGNAPAANAANAPSANAVNVVNAANVGFQYEDYYAESTGYGTNYDSYNTYNSDYNNYNNYGNYGNYGDYYDGYGAYGSNGSIASHGSHGSRGGDKKKNLFCCFFPWMDHSNDGEEEDGGGALEPASTDSESVAATSGAAGEKVKGANVVAKKTKQETPIASTDGRAIKLVESAKSVEGTSGAKVEVPQADRAAQPLSASNAKTNSNLKLSTQDNGDEVVAANGKQASTEEMSGKLATTSTDASAKSTLKDESETAASTAAATAAATAASTSKSATATASKSASASVAKPQPKEPVQPKSILKVKHALHHTESNDWNDQNKQNGTSNTNGGASGNGGKGGKGANEGKGAPGSSPTKDRRHLFPTYEPKHSDTLDATLGTSPTKHATSPNHSSQSLTSPHTPSPKPPKSLNFNPMARVLTIPSRKDMPLSQKTQVWWQKVDYDEFKKTGRIISKAMECGGSEIWLNSSNQWGDMQQLRLKRLSGHGGDNDGGGEEKKEGNDVVNSARADASSEDNEDNDSSSPDYGNKWWCKFGHSRRGLEHIASSDEGKARQQSVLLAIRKILEEQKRQRQQRRKDPTKLRNVAMNYTTWARDLALAAGMADAEAVKSGFDGRALSRAHYFARSVENGVGGSGVAKAVTSQILDEHTHARRASLPLKKSKDESSLDLEKEEDSISKRAKGFMG